MRPLVKVDFDYDETENTAREYLMRLAVLGQPPGTPGRCTGLVADDPARQLFGLLTGVPVFCGP